MSRPGRDDRPLLDRWLARAFDDDEPVRIGSGWLSGTASVFLGLLGLLAVFGAAGYWLPVAIAGYLGQ